MMLDDQIKRQGDGAVVGESLRCRFTCQKGGDDV